MCGNVRGELFSARSRSILMSIPFRAAALLIVFVAFIVRVYDLGVAGVDGDEAFSIHAAYMGFSRIIQMTTSVEPHPPLFYAFLRLWYMVVGSSEFALRYPSLIANVLAIGFLFGLARQISGRAVALVVITLFALNPHQVYYSQYVRM